MKKQRYKVQAYCNVFGEHNCRESELIDKIEANFDSIFDATDYLFECTVPITKITELIPDLEEFEGDELLKEITSTCKDLDEFINNQREIGSIYKATQTAWEYYY